VGNPMGETSFSSEITRYHKARPIATKMRQHVFCLVKGQSPAVGFTYGYSRCPASREGRRRSNGRLILAPMPPIPLLGSGSVWPISVLAFFIPNPAKYPLSIVSECAVVRPEVRIAPAHSSIITRRFFIPNPSSVRPAPMMRIGALGEIFVCCRDHFAVDPALRGFAADSASANPLPSLNSCP